MANDSVSTQYNTVHYKALMHTTLQLQKLNAAEYKAWLRYIGSNVYACS